jgi:hypothetical protein
MHKGCIPPVRIRTSEKEPIRAVVRFVICAQRRVYARRLNKNLGGSKIPLLETGVVSRDRNLLFSYTGSRLG